MYIPTENIELMTMTDSSEEIYLNVTIRNIKTNTIVKKVKVILGGWSRGYSRWSFSIGDITSNMIPVIMHEYNPVVIMGIVKLRYEIICKDGTKINIIFTTYREPTTEILQLCPVKKNKTTHTNANGISVDTVSWR
jgi:hypothetical protein